MLGQAPPPLENSGTVVVATPDPSWDRDGYITDEIIIELPRDGRPLTVNYILRNTNRRFASPRPERDTVTAFGNAAEMQ